MVLWLCTKNTWQHNREFNPLNQDTPENPGVPEVDADRDDFHHNNTPGRPCTRLRASGEKLFEGSEAGALAGDVARLVCRAAASEMIEIERPALLEPTAGEAVAGAEA